LYLKSLSVEFEPLIQHSPNGFGGIQSVSAGRPLYKDRDGDIAHDFFLVAEDERSLQRIGPSELIRVGAYNLGHAEPTSLGMCFE